MPLDFSRIIDVLGQSKKKQPVSGATVQGQGPQAPGVTPTFNPAAAQQSGTTQPDVPAPPTVFKSPQATTPVFNPQPKTQAVGDIDSARAPRFDQIDPKLIGGGRLQSEEELTDLRSKGLVRPQNNFSFGDRLKSALKTALPGLLQGGIGGAIAGAVGGAVDPRMGRRYQFETFQQPSIDAAQKRQQEEQARQTAAEQAAAETAYKTSQAGRLDAQADLDRAKAEQEIAQGPLTQKKLQSEIDFNNARAEAARTGQPKDYEVEEDDGTVSIYRVTGDGTQSYVGKSGKAAIANQQIQSREKIATEGRQTQLTIAGMHEAGADRRQGRSEAAQDRRARDERGRPNYNQLDTDAGKFEDLKTRAIETLNDPKATQADRDNAMREYQQQAARIEKNYGGKVRVNRDNPDWPGIEIVSPDEYRAAPAQPTRQPKPASAKPAGRISEKDIQGYMKQFGVSRAQAIADAKADGLM